MKEVVIVSGARTPIGDFQGSLQSFNPIDLGVFALKGALERAGIGAELLDEVVGGHYNQSSSPGNSARHIALKAGCRDDP